MFRPSDSRCLFLDWKNAKMASGTLDLAFLLFSSVSNRIISESLTDILKLYHETLVDTLRRLEPKCQEPTMEQLEKDFMLSLPDALLQAIVMFVREMQFLELSSVDSEGKVVEETAQRLRVYEKMAMNLLKIIEVEPRRLDDEAILRLRVRTGDSSRMQSRDHSRRQSREDDLEGEFSLGEEDEE